MKSEWVERDAQATVDHYARAGVGPIWRCASTRPACSAAIPSWCCTAAATPRSRPSCPTSSARRSRCSASRARAPTWRRSSPTSMPAVRLDRLRRLRQRDALSDDDMVRILRENLIDPMAPNPSVEVLLHAFLPHKFVDHTHATAVLSLVDQPDGEAICSELYDGRAASCPTSCRALRSPRSRGDPPRKPEGRRADPAQARHLHLRRERAAKPTSA